MASAPVTEIAQGVLARGSLICQSPPQVEQPAHTSGLSLIAATPEQERTEQVLVPEHPVQKAQSPSDSDGQACVGQLPSTLHPHPEQAPSPRPPHGVFEHNG